MARERGSAMVIILVGALVASVAAYSVLLITTSQAHTTHFSRERMKTRYITEAGYVLATQRLLIDREYPSNATNCPAPFCTIVPGQACTGGNPAQAVEVIDTNGNGTVDATDPQVTITVENCGGSNRRTIKVSAQYD